MICPVALASDLSAFQAARVGDHAKHGLLLEGRRGAGDESTGSYLAGAGQEDHLVAGCFWQVGLAHFGGLIWPTPGMLKIKRTAFRSAGA